MSSEQQKVTNLPYKSDRSDVQTFNVGGGMMTDTKAIFHAEGHKTGQSFGMIEIFFRHGDVAGAHVHKFEDEGFFVIEGELTLHCPGRASVVATAGEFVWAPRNMPHYYDVTGEEGARVLVIAVPGSFQTPFFRALAEGKGAEIDDEAKIKEFMDWAEGGFGLGFFEPDHEFAPPEW